MDSNQGTSPVDAFAGMWRDFASRVGIDGSAGSQGRSNGPDPAKQMQRALFDAWAAYCDEIMRSPQFCEMLKQSMDNALGLKKQVNEFLTKMYHEGQMPSRSDVDDLQSLIRLIEDRVLGRLDRLEQQMEELRTGRSKPVATGSATPSRQTRSSTSAAQRSGTGGRKKGQRTGRA